MARTLVDLSAVLERDALELALEDALRRRLTSIPTLKMALLETGRGRRAARTLRELVDAREQHDRTTDSQLEVRVLQALTRAGFPPPVPQYEVSGPDGFRARLDFAYPQSMVAIEADSYRWHSGRRAFGRDRERLSKLAGLGWRIVFVTSAEVSDPGGAWLGSLRRLIGQQRFDQLP